jgi:hypothetical protein
MNHEEAVKALAAFEKRGKQIAEEQKRLTEAKRVLHMDHHDIDRLSGSMIELAGLKETWTLLGGVFKSLAELKDTAWLSLHVPKVCVARSTMCSSALLSRGTERGRASLSCCLH